MTFETLSLSHAGGVATLTLNRPDAANAMNIKMAEELMKAAIQFDEDPSVRAVILTGAGSSMFCAGGDLASFSAEGDRLPSVIKEMTTYLHAAISRFARMDAPLIAAVNGTAAGAGFSLVLMADLVWSVGSAKFTLAYTRAGLVPDGSSTYYLSRIVGLRRAQELALTNRVLTAPEAENWGIVNRVVGDDDLMAEVGKLAAGLAVGPTGAYGEAKRLMNMGTQESLETQMELEARGIAGAARGHDAQEGIRAFLEKRPAKFDGNKI